MLLINVAKILPIPSARSSLSAVGEPLLMRGSSTDIAQDTTIALTGMFRLGDTWRSFQLIGPCEDATAPTICTYSDPGIPMCRVMDQIKQFAVAMYATAPALSGMRTIKLISVVPNLLRVVL